MKSSGRVVWGWNRLRSALGCVSLVALLAGTGHAQTTVGQILGTITDSSGLPAPNATVSVINEGTNETRKTTADRTGDYVFPQLPVGRYTLTVEHAGFQRFVTTGIDLKVDDRRRQDV